MCTTTYMSIRVRVHVRACTEKKILCQLEELRGVDLVLYSVVSPH